MIENKEYSMDNQNADTISSLNISSTTSQRAVQIEKDVSSFDSEKYGRHSAHNNKNSRSL